MRAWREDREEASCEAASHHARQVHVALAIAVEEILHRIAVLLAPQAEKHIIVAVEYGYQFQPLISSRHGGYGNGRVIARPLPSVH
jgi:hypothetical protein